MGRPFRLTKTRMRFWPARYLTIASPALPNKKGGRITCGRPLVMPRYGSGDRFRSGKLPCRERHDS